MRRDHTSGVSEVQEFPMDSQVEFDDIERLVIPGPSIQDYSPTCNPAGCGAPTKWRIRASSIVIDRCDNERVEGSLNGTATASSVRRWIASIRGGVKSSGHRHGSVRRLRLPKASARVCGLAAARRVCLHK